MNTTPQVSYDATQARIALRNHIRGLRDDAKQRGKAHADADHLYKRELAKAHQQIDAPNAEKREAEAYQWELAPDVQEQGVRIAEAGGLGEYRPTTVGELRWMRDRIKVIADYFVSVAYDAKEEFGALQEELRMVRQEREQEAFGPAVTP